jgi:hypothetical protein
MANVTEKDIYEIEFTKRDAEIKRLELMRAEVEEELEEGVKAFVKAGGDKRLKKPSRPRVTSALLDGKSFSK